MDLLIKQITAIERRSLIIAGRIDQRNAASNAYERILSFLPIYLALFSLRVPRRIYLRLALLSEVLLGTNRKVLTIGIASNSFQAAAVSSAAAFAGKADQIRDTTRKLGISVYRRSV